MFFPNNSSSAFFPSSAALRRRPRRRSASASSSASSLSSSAFSSQHHFTQSDTEAEEEKKYRRRREHHQQPRRREVVTPGALMIGRRRDLLASCSTPRSSQEDLLLLPAPDDLSVYFRPPPATHFERRAKKGQQINEYCGTARKSRKPGRAGEGDDKQWWKMMEGKSRTPTQLRKQRVPRSRRRYSNPMEEEKMRMMNTEEEEEEKCSSPILLDFFQRTTPTEEKTERVPNGGRGDEPPKVPHLPHHPTKHHHSPEAGPFRKWSPPLFSPFGRHYALLKMTKMKKKDERKKMKEAEEGRKDERMKKGEAEEWRDEGRYTNLPWGHGIGGTTEPTVATRNSNSDSGMEERVEEDDDRTQFVNISAVEKVYENLPPLAPKPQPPRAPQIPPNPPPGMAFLPQQLVDDFPALYARLVALALWDARKAASGEQIQMAQKQIAELVGMKLGKHTQLMAAEGEEQFRRKCAEFCSQLAQKLRNSEAHSRKEFAWQTKKLQKILHQLRTDTTEQGKGTLQKLIKRIFRK